MINRTRYTEGFAPMVRAVPWWWWLALAWFTLVSLVTLSYLLATIQGQPPVSPRDGGQESRPQGADAGESRYRTQVSEAERRAGALVASRGQGRGSPSARSAPSPDPFDAALDYQDAVKETVLEAQTPDPIEAVPGKPAEVGSGLLPEPWLTLARCESGLNPRAVNPAGYYGLFQFSLSTWASVGGTGNPIDASVDEQLERAIILQARSGWGQWPVCGAGL